MDVLGETPMCSTVDSVPLDAGAEDLVDAVPYWSAQLFPSGGGQDHLGIGSVVTDQVLPSLSPGINVLTVHPRYWSFYAFVLDEFWMRDGLPRTSTALRDWYRPMECLYSVACLLCESESHRATPIGTRRLNRLASADESFDPRYDYMDSPMGGYGLYYAATMETVGLVVRANPKIGVPVDTVTADGRKVAEAFRASIVDTSYYQQWLGRHDEDVPRSVLAEYSKTACFCRLREATAQDRPLLADVVLHHGAEPQAQARRQTLRMMCDIARQTKDAPVDENAFRRLVFYGQDHQPPGEPAVAYVPSEPLVRTARRWRLYQTREYFNAALNEMWRRLSAWGLEHDGDHTPVPMTEVINTLDDIDPAGFASALGVDLPPNGLSGTSPYTDLLDWVRAAGKVRLDLDQRWPLDAALTEDAIIDWLGYGRYSDRCGSDVLAGALTLATFVAARLWTPELALVEPADWFPVRAGGRERLGMQRFITDLRDRATAGATVVDVARWLTSDYVIAQHERVATAKLATTGDTFRFRREAGRLRFFRKDATVGMNNSRFNSLATFVYELGWAGYLYEPGHDVTEEGGLLLASGDIPATGVFDDEVAEAT